MSLLRSKDGAIEVPWPEIRDLRPERCPARILAHKFTAYVYNKSALAYLTGVSPTGLLVLCVRNPVRALVSWYNMHQSIAISGKNKAHFAWREREFYAHCTLEDYYEHFARSRLKYDDYLWRVLEIVPRERIAVVSQERMAQDIDSVAVCLKSLVGVGTRATPQSSSGPLSTYQGYADKAGIAPDSRIVDALHGVQKNVEMIVEENVVHKWL